MSDIVMPQNFNKLHSSCYAPTTRFQDGSVLEPSRVFEDIITDYAHKTVTLDPHPHNGRTQASVHPCKSQTTVYITKLH